jgi:two-component system CheB/CheR fusion protein
VVDDNRDVGGSLVMALGMLGFRGSATTNGEGALALAVTEKPEIMLIDLCLPGLSGWDLARRIRGSELPRRPRLVAITGLTDSVFRLRSMAAGFDEHLVKPVHFDELKRVLAALT